MQQGASINIKIEIFFQIVISNIIKMAYKPALTQTNLFQNN